MGEEKRVGPWNMEENTQDKVLSYSLHLTCVACAPLLVRQVGVVLEVGLDDATIGSISVTSYHLSINVTVTPNRT
jgi:hypothetical protein